MRITISDVPNAEYFALLKEMSHALHEALQKPRQLDNERGLPGIKMSPFQLATSIEEAIIPILKRKGWLVTKKEINDGNRNDDQKGISSEDHQGGGQETSDSNSEASATQDGGGEDQQGHSPRDHQA